MKKTILKTSFIAALLMFASCSDDDDNNGEIPDVDVVYSGQLDYTIGTKVNISSWSWKDAVLTGSSSDNKLTGTVTSDITLDGVYELTGTYIIPDGFTLTMEAGTEIIAAPATGVANFEANIVIAQGAQLIVNGTSSDPVVLSSVDGNPADWGGLIICGKGVTSSGVDTEFEVGNYLYGGTVADDNSGSIEYLVVRGSGGQIDSESQTNGISFCAVGSGTTIENVAVFNGGDDGVEFYGGSVSVENLYLENNQDDAIDWTESWDGAIENAYILHDIAGFSTVFEGDKDNAWPDFTNITAISNYGGTALQFKKESGGNITNLYLEGYDLEIDFVDEGAAANVQIDGSDAVVVAVD